MASLSQTNSSAWAPFRIAPAFSERVWGYQDLRPWYDLTVESGVPIGEAWLTGDQCLVANGVHAGKTLAALFADNSENLLGKSAPSSGSPLLIKVIFAREKLSVQVHPDDRMAQKYGEPRGKTECWYALQAQPGAQVACGLKPGVTIEDIKAEIQAGELEGSLNLLDVAPGDMIFVDAGTVHAIWPGSILLETQQNCDLTYRMFDYGRGRELHIAKSLEATHLESRAGKIQPVALADRTILIDGDYFRMERISTKEPRQSASLPGEGERRPGLAYLFVAKGEARIAAEGLEPLVLPKGGIAAVPAGSPAFTVEDPARPEAGELELIRISPRWPQAD